MTIIESYWFGTIGIVKGHNGFETKWYIGQGLGFDQRSDEQHIAAHGMPFRPESMKYFFEPVQYLNDEPEEDYIDHVLQYVKDPDEAERIASLPFDLWPDHVPNPFQ
jgi:hypothetical protein